VLDDYVLQEFHRIEFLRTQKKKKKKKKKKNNSVDMMELIEDSFDFKKKRKRY
jgi:hypothetical protein